MKNLETAFATDSIMLGLRTSSMETICAEMLDRLVERGRLTKKQRDLAFEAIMSREQESSCAIGQAVAVPHAYLKEIDEPILMFARLARPAPLGAPDRILTRFVFLLIGPPRQAADHIDTMANIARLMSDDEFHYRITEADDAADFLAALRDFQERTAQPSKAAEQPDDGLAYTGRPFGGIVNDIRRRAPWYKRDFLDGVHPKIVGATLFLFFACVAPAVTFGGVMADKTDGSIGAVEMLLASAICGTLYALFSGMPLIILGGTGPLLVITAVLFDLCTDLGIPFLPTYTWVGLWSALMLILLAIFEASALMRLFTRFTDEAFAALISLIFIYEAVKAILGFFDLSNPDASHDSAFFSVILALGCFSVAIGLFRFRRSRYLYARIREFLADFGPTFAIVSMTGLALYFGEIDVANLAAPDEFGTTSGRPWLVDMFALPAWVYAASAIPALLVTILVYLDQNITARVVNVPEHKLKKGATYHLDLAWVGGLMAVCSVFGLPWLVAATVRSLNHVKALASSEEKIGVDGTPREQIVHVRETRLTGLGIHILIGLSLLALPWIKLIPMSVLYGLFLYMGVVSLRGNQFFERMLLLLTDPSLYPSTHYVRRVPRPIIHVFTLVQLLGVVVLWIVKVSAMALLFPLFIALLVPVRFLLGRFIDDEYLRALDSDETPEEEEEKMAGA